MGTIEILGFAAGIFVLASFVMRGEIWIRIVNSFGAALFAIYGLIIGAWAIWVINLLIVIVHIIYLFLPKRGAKVNHEKA